MEVRRRRAQLSEGEDMLGSNCQRRERERR